MERIIRTCCWNRRCCPIPVQFLATSSFFSRTVHPLADRARETVALLTARGSIFHCCQSATSQQPWPQPCWLQGVGYDAGPRLLVLYYFQFTFHLSVPSLLLTICSTSSMLMTLNCTSLYLQARILSHRSLPLAFTQRPLSESYEIGCCSVWYSAKAPRIATHYIHQHRRLCCTSLWYSHYTRRQPWPDWIYSDTSIACVNHLTTTSALFAISEPLCQMISDWVLEQP